MTDCQDELHELIGLQRATMVGGVVVTVLVVVMLFLRLTDHSGVGKIYLELQSVKAEVRTLREEDLRIKPRDVMERLDDLQKELKKLEDMQK